MPATAKLHRFHESFGTISPPTSWIGAISVDTSYQTHLRDELNRERFRETIRVEIRAQLAELKREHDSKRNFDQIMLAGFLGMLFIEALLYWAVLSG